MSEELKSMKQTLLAAAQSQMGNLDKVNAEELGEVIDMIKDLEEAEYYCSITKAMEESKKEREDNEKAMLRTAASRSQQYYSPEYMRWLDPRYDCVPGYPGERPDRMYYGGNGSSGNNGGGSSSGGSTSGGNSGGYNASASGNNARGYYEYNNDRPYYPPEMRDYREGRSPASRRGYMESKEMHQDSNTQMHKLEKYINELSNDIVEMTSDSTPEEKDLLYQKLTTLASRIQ